MRFSQKLSSLALYGLDIDDLKSYVGFSKNPKMLDPKIQDDEQYIWNSMTVT